MLEDIIQSFGLLAQTLEMVGASALILGFAVVTVIWFVMWRREGMTTATGRYRVALGRVTLVGLELLVAAAIVKTVTQELAVEWMPLLVIMVAIRTLLGWSTALEMTGRWPWQSSQG